MGMYVHKKIDLHNFGCDRIFVISDPDNVERRQSFIDDWKYFDGFNYEFIDSVNYKKGHFDIGRLLRSGEMSGEWHDLQQGKGSQPGLTENMIGIGLAHKNIWEIANSGHGRKFLILEDDARPNDNLIDYIYDGTYKLLIERLHKRYCDIFWIGRTSTQIVGDPLDDLFQIPKSHIGICSHSYIVDKWCLYKLINDYKLQMPVDIFIEYMSPNMSGVLTNVYSPYFSLIEQKGHIIGKWLHEDPTDPDYIFSTTSQVNIFNETPLEYPWRYTSPLMREYCDDNIEVYEMYGYKWTRTTLTPPPQRLL